MAVSDETGGKKPRAPRGPLKILTSEEWRRIQTHYETDPNRIALRPLADFYGVPRQTVMLRAAREKWRRRDHITTLARREIEQTAQIAMKDVATPIIKEMTEKAFADLQPWMERKKRKHIRSLVTLGEKGIARVRKLMDNADPKDAKVEAFTSKTAETWDSIIRRNLGMNDSTGLGGSLSINVLTNQAAVQVTQN